MPVQGALSAAGELEQRIKEVQKDEEERQHARADEAEERAAQARAEADDPPPGVDPESAGAAAAAAEREAQDIAAGNDAGGVFRRMHLYQRLVPSRHTLQMLDTDAAILQARDLCSKTGLITLCNVPALSCQGGDGHPASHGPTAQYRHVSARRAKRGD